MSKFFTVGSFAGVSRAFAMLAALAWLGLAMGEDEKAEGKQTEAKKTDRIGLVVESTTAGAKVYTPIPGAKSTVLAAAWEWEYGLRLFSDMEWRKRGYDIEDFYEEAEKTADGVADALEPEIVRDSRQVVEYVLLRSEDVFLSSALTSKRFLPRFQELLGDELRVVVVDRHIMYVFPAIGGKLESYAGVLVDIYAETRFPGSLEIFQVNEEGYRVLGSLDSRG